MNAARILVPTLFLTACGGGFSSDLETDRRVSTLSEYEAISLCQSATEHVSSAMEAAQWTDYLCTSVAVGEYVTNEFDARSDARRDCDQATYECTGSREIYGRTFRDFVDCSEIEDYDYEDCPATVRELETCIEEFREASPQWAEEIACDVGPDWRPSRVLSAACAALVDDSDCGVFLFGE